LLGNSKKKLLSGEGAHSRRFTRPATRLRALFSKLSSHSVFTAGLPGFFYYCFQQSLSCVLCPKAGSVDDGATGSCLQLFSLTPGN